MPTPGQAFPVDNDWRERVMEAMRREGVNRAQLAKLVKCGRSSITELLGPETPPPGWQPTMKQSPLVPAIHKALKLPPPATALMSEDDLELFEIWRSLGERGKGRVLESARIARTEEPKRK